MSNISIKNKTLYNGSNLVSGGTQGALWYDNKIYQFGDGGYLQIVDDTTFAKIGSQVRLPAYADNTSSYPHFSSVEWIVPGQKFAATTNATGLAAYADRFYIYDISDLSNVTQEIVMMACTDRMYYARMAAMAYDQTNKIMYVAGYTSKSTNTDDSANWFEAFDFSGYIDNGTLTAPLLKTAQSSNPGYHLQDGGFYKGYIYYLCDRNTCKSGGYNGMYIWVLNNNFETVTVMDVYPGNTAEAEAFAIKGEDHAVTFISSIFLNGNTYVSTRIGVREIEPCLTLSKSVNVVGYTINGVENRNDTIQLEAGTYTITPILKENAVWHKWSDDNTTQTREFVLTDSDELEITAYGIQETVYLTGTPAPITQSTRGTSINLSATATNVYFIISSNANYQNEYMLVSDGLQNDNDQDIRVMGATKHSASEIQYFNENSIDLGEYYFTAIPEGYTKFKITIHNGTGEDNTPTSRNPNFFVFGGDSLTSMCKVYGSNTDPARPLSSSIIETGVVYDLSALNTAAGVVDCTPNLKKYNFISIRLIGNAARLNNSYAEIQFIKD